MDEETIFSMTQKLEQSIVNAGENTSMISIEETSGRYLLLFIGTWKEELSFEVRSYIRRLRLVEPDTEFTTATSRSTTISTTVRRRMSLCAGAVNMRSS